MFLVPNQRKVMWVCSKRKCFLSPYINIQSQQIASEFSLSMTLQELWGKCSLFFWNTDLKQLLSLSQSHLYPSLAKPSFCFIFGEMKPRHITTSWSLTYFWAILSILLATLSTFSFVQVEWIVKRETQVITHYHFPTVNTTAINLSHETDTLYNRWASNRYQISGREQHNYEVVKRVQKTVTVFSFGALGSCVHYQGLSNHCRSHDHGQGIWCVSDKFPFCIRYMYMGNIQNKTTKVSSHNLLDSLL